MSDVTLADAKAKLSELVERAAQGETVTITRRGKPVACLVGIHRKPKPIDFSALRSLRDSMPAQSESAATWLRAMRDDARY
jgi:prevent-host-death family protein